MSDKDVRMGSDEDVKMGSSEDVKKDSNEDVKMGSDSEAEMPPPRLPARLPPRLVLESPGRTLSDALISPHQLPSPVRPVPVLECESTFAGRKRRNAFSEGAPRKLARRCSASHVDVTSQRPKLDKEAPKPADPHGSEVVMSDATPGTPRPDSPTIPEHLLPTAAEDQQGPASASTEADTSAGRALDPCGVRRRHSASDPRARGNDGLNLPRAPIRPLPPLNLPSGTTSLASSSPVATGARPPDEKESKSADKK